jgi:phage antirepressor YoqD-like protein
MSNLIAFNPVNSLTMTSREIAELTDKEVNHVHRDIRAMVEQLGDDPDLHHLREDKDARGYTTCFHLSKSLSMTLVAGYNVKLRKAIIDRWQALEAQASKVTLLLPNFEDPAAAAMAWAEQFREKQAAMVQAEQANTLLALAAPKIEALERIATSTENVTLTQAAKVLGVKRDTLSNWMHTNGWVYRQNGSWVAYDAQIRTGRLVYKEAHFTDDKTDQRAIKPYCHITPKGLAWLAEHGPKAEAA